VSWGEGLNARLKPFLRRGVQTSFGSKPMLDEVEEREKEEGHA
jgi:hypothetical protein